MIYVYAIVDSPRPDVAGLRGVSDEPLDVQPSGGIGAVYSPYHAGRPEPSADNAWRHEKVVEALMAHHAVLPTRFATLFRERSDLEATLAKIRDPLARGLDRVRGRVELGLRVLWKGAQPERLNHVTSGRDYMLARLAEDRQRREAEQFAERLHAPLAGLSADSTRRVLVAPALLLSAAYLVERERTGAFRDAVSRLGAEHPSVRLLCTGPWPPYHFVPPIVDAA